MSQYRTETIDCPACAGQGEFHIWDSVNVSLNPDLKEKIFTEELFIWVCPYCGAKVYIPYGFIYHDMHNHFMIFYTSDEECIDKYEPLDIPDHVRHVNYTFRAVYGIVPLKEKIRQLESGLDDIAIERLKYILTHFKVKEFIANKTELHYLDCDTSDRGFSEYGSISFMFVNNEGQTMEGKYGMEIYYESEVAVKIDPRMNPGDNPCIDQEWMSKQFKKSKYE
jgi:hypothetical protein